MKYLSLLIIVLSLLIGCSKDDNGTNPQPELTNQIAFISKQGNTNPQIHLMNSDGSNQRSISDLSKKYDNPSWSPDCETIYYDDGFYGFYYKIGSKTAFKISKDYLIHPFPSPDGKRLVALSLDNDFHMYVNTLNTDGTNAVNIASGTNCTTPSWSLNGKNITFCACPNWPYDVFVTDVNGNNLKWLTKNSSTKFNDSDPIFSPDCKYIAFTATRDGNSEIYIMNNDGTNPINLTNNPFEDKHPTFSPDGKYIAFSSNRDGNYQIFIMDIDGKNLKNISNNANEETMPCWSSK